MGRRSKTFHSVLGPLRLKGAYYYCASCGHGLFPRDGHLGMEDSSLSPAVTRMTGTVGALLRYWRSLAWWQGPSMAMALWPRWRDFWRPELLFVLRQEVAMYDTYQQPIAECDQQLQKHLASFVDTIRPQSSPAERR